MTDKDEALKLALDALEEYHYGEARIILRQALAQPDAFEQGRQEGMKQERALWELSRIGQEIEAQPDQKPMHPELRKMWEDYFDKCFRAMPLPEYTTPPQRPWVGLTDEAMKDALISVDAETRRLPPGFKDFARAIEAKLKEKNT